MDAEQWFDLIRQDVPSRALNRRYLVVPVYRSPGVFHPKLNLLLSESGGQIQCGSNNLTRSGCSSNLELLNAIPFEMKSDSKEQMILAQEAFAFFRGSSEYTDDEVGRIVREWLDETAAMFPWLLESLELNKKRSFRLVQTYDGGIWERIEEMFEYVAPQRLIVLSPFYDRDAELLRRARQQWPLCEIEILVQQGYTNLPIVEVKKLRSGVTISEVKNYKRRLHAKLLAWESIGQSGCLVGSANFTVAAFDGRNVEACLLVSNAGSLLSSLFDNDLPKHSIKLDDFEPGSETEPEAETSDLPDLRISSAILLADGQFRVRYTHNLPKKPPGLRVAIRSPGETRPRFSVRVTNRNEGLESVNLPENVLAGSHGTLLASLIAEMPGGRLESAAVWIIQEARLTHEPGDGSPSPKGKIEVTGEGLVEFLDGLGRREGISAVIDYLRHLNIRFQDGARGLQGKRRFRIRVHDPYKPDTAPEWLINAKSQSDDLESAIYNFVDRHEKGRLHRHASRGNINGMDNFIDIFTTIIRLLYVYYLQGIVKREKLIVRITNLIEISTSGKEDEHDPTDGYLFSLYVNLGSDFELLQEVCEETNFPAEIRTALLIAQKVRYVPDEKPIHGQAPKRPRDVLLRWVDLIHNALTRVKIEQPSRENVKTALEGYRMFSKQEVDRLIAEL